MAKYRVVVTNKSGDGQQRTFTFNMKQLFLLTVFVLVLITSLASISVINRNLKNDIIKELSYVDTDISLSTVSISEAVVMIEKGINAIYYSDLFVEEIFDEYVSDRFNLVIFYEKMTNAKGYVNLLKLYNKYDNNNLSYLMRLLGRVDSEIIKRQVEYKALVSHLRQREIIAEHTPNIMPGDWTVTSRFGFRRSPITGVNAFHEGIDFGSGYGVPVRATASGVVVLAETRTSYGYVVTIDHGFGFITRYAHNSVLTVTSGTVVQKGDIIARSGDTGRSAGAHVHYEVLYNGTPVNAIKFLPGYN